MDVPLTGAILYDAAIAIMIFFFGLWIVVRFGNKFGYFIIAIAAIWGWKLYTLTGL